MNPGYRDGRNIPACCAGHVAWGLGSGLVSGVDGFALLCGGWAYQFGSGWRKSETGGIDTVGLDAFDYPVGYVVGLAARKAVGAFLL